MRIYVSIVVTSVLCGGVLAATVRQRSADDYYFSRPNLPSNIVGTVMGDPPAYHIPRSEDVAWLREAWAERVALAGGSPFGNSWTGVLADVVVQVPEFGKWPMSETNRFAKWTTGTFVVGSNVVTNIVVGYSVVTNKGGGVDTPTIQGVNPWYGLDAYLVANTNNMGTGFLSLSNDLYITSATVHEEECTTNIFDQTVWFDSWTNGTNFVSMPMTNGTTSVFTNIWRVYSPTSAVVRMTNITLHTELGVPGIFKDGTIHGLNRPLPPPLDGLLATAGITNHYASLRQAVRLAKSTEATNKAFKVLSGGYVKDPEDYVVRTNGHATVPRIYLSCLGSSSNWYEPEWDEDSDPVHDPPDSWKHVSRSGGRTVFDVTEAARQKFTIIMSAFAAAPDDNLSIKSARAFADVDLSFTERSSSSGGRNGDQGESYSTNINRIATVPLGVVSPEIDADGKISFSIQLSDQVLHDAWGAAQFPQELPNSNKWIPSPRFSLPAAGHDKLNQWSGNTGTTMEFEAGFYANGITVLIDFAPRASLPGWND